jgi:hypothetical protein
MSGLTVIARGLTLFLLGVFLFFGYSILRVVLIEQTPPTNSGSLDGFASEPKQAEQYFPLPMQEQEQAPPAYIPPPAQVSEPVPIPMPPQPTIAPIEPPQEEMPMPKVAGQTSEDLRASEPLQETPPTIQYDPPEATDPLNRTVHMNATFGSNLRHPEQLIEKRPRRRMHNAVQSGIASPHTQNFGRGGIQYSEEMIQNGGLMSSGLMANDMSLDNGGRLAFSML